MIDIVVPKASRTAHIHSYTILGDPLKLARSTGPYRSRNWNADKEQQVMFTIELTNQHNDAPLLTGPLQLIVSFYCPPPKLLTHAKQARLLNTWMITKPSLGTLMSFIEYACHGIVFGDEALIVDVRSVKIYDEQPRTELQIIPL